MKPKGKPETLKNVAVERHKHRKNVQAMVDGLELNSKPIILASDP
jgi:hypothetical protein